MQFLMIRRKISCLLIFAVSSVLSGCFPVATILDTEWMLCKRMCLGSIGLDFVKKKTKSEEIECICKDGLSVIVITDGLY